MPNHLECPLLKATKDVFCEVSPRDNFYSSQRKLASFLDSRLV